MCRFRRSGTGKKDRELKQGLVSDDVEQEKMNVEAMKGLNSDDVEQKKMNGDSMQGLTSDYVEQEKKHGEFEIVAVKESIRTL